MTEIRHRTRSTEWPRHLPFGTRVLAPESREEAAQIIAESLRNLAGDDDVRRVFTWVGVAERLRLRPAEYADARAESGLYKPPTYEDGRGIIAINVALSEEVQVRAWIHEIAHHKLHVWVPVQLRHAADAYSYVGDIEEVRHEIARRVEELILG